MVMGLGCVVAIYTETSTAFGTDVDDAVESVATTKRAGSRTGEIVPRRYMPPPLTGHIVSR